MATRPGRDPDALTVRHPDRIRRYQHQTSLRWGDKAQTALEQRGHAEPSRGRIARHRGKPRISAAAKYGRAYLASRLDAQPAALEEAAGAMSLWVRYAVGTPLEERTAYTFTADEPKRLVADISRVLTP